MNRRLIIDIEGLQCTAWIEGGDGLCMKKAVFKIGHGAVCWNRLLGEVSDHLQLHSFAPPGMPMEGGESCADPFQVWQVVKCGIPAAPGFGWGFMLPFASGVPKGIPGAIHKIAAHVLPLEAKQRVPVDTCCGFRDQAAAAKAAKTMQHHCSRITGDLPGGVFEIFMLDGVYAFLDFLGEIHATFPTHAEARGCASKTEAEQMQSTNSTPNATQHES